MLDRIALVVAGLGVAVSFLAHQPLLAILGVMLADVSGTVLTIHKTFLSPGSETTVSWLLVGTGALCGVLLVGSLRVELLVYPVYLMIANYSIPLAQLAGRLYARQRKAAV